MSWQAWWPDHGEDESDAVTLDYDDHGNITEIDFELAAEKAGWYAEHYCDGWESGFDEEVIVMIKAPNGDTRKMYYVREESVDIRSGSKR